MIKIAQIQVRREKGAASLQDVLNIVLPNADAIIGTFEYDDTWSDPNRVDPIVVVLYRG